MFVLGTSGSSAAPGSSVTPKWAKKSTINFMEVDEVQDINNQQATLKQKEEEGIFLSQFFTFLNSIKIRKRT